jgi:hypothetical protein
MTSIDSWSSAHFRTIGDVSGESDDLMMDILWPRSKTTATQTPYGYQQGGV